MWYEGSEGIKMILIYVSESEHISYRQGVVLAILRDVQSAEELRQCFEQ